ncbi:unnamed protein product [Chondrus crispus]|uniref:Plant heme peroxidase family profile domain-containing protein n=1 Tax=Chondrus crispus TaxID=2769 RepID=R7QBE6_CHOCR|nr:unnamed protein product [Chondrus crispus]CDF35088.1 unnamed protein product [Chondrus crispus]|eukprot:XP_005714907.1 unnamed protein product [Chondrus crispus]
MRGTPYYPPATPHQLLPLSETSVSLRAAVARHLTTDAHWLRASPEDAPARLAPRLLAWYRFAAANLRVLSLSPRHALAPALVSDIIATVAANRPPLRVLDLSVFALPAPPTEHFVHTLDALFRAARLSLVELHLNLAADFLLDLAADAHLVALTTLDLRHEGPLDPMRLLSLLHSLRELTATTSLKPKLETLHFRLSEPLPPGLRPEAIAAATPAVKNLRYTELSALRADCTELGVPIVQLATVLKGLEELVLTNATLDFSLLQPLLERDSHRHLTRVSLNNCSIPGFLSGFPLLRSSSDSLIRSLDLADVTLGASELAVVAERCSAVEAFGLSIERATAAALRRVCVSLPQLASMDLRVVGAKDEPVRQGCRDGIVSAVCATRGEFSKLVVRGETLPVAGLAQIFRTLGARFEYLVTGVHAPRVSMSRAIMGLLAVVKEHCTAFKILCFGLDLAYDPRADDLHEAFVKTIDGLEDRLPMLDTVWLRRNAESLLAIQKPVGFVEFREGEGDLDLTA